MGEPLISENLAMDGALDTDIPYPSIREAWADCSEKLKYFRDLVATWPH